MSNCGTLRCYSSDSMINVPLLDLKAQFAQIRDEVMPLIERVCASQQFILGEHVRGLEAEIAGTAARLSASACPRAPMRCCWR